jgi:hypothetical protein
LSKLGFVRKIASTKVLKAAVLPASVILTGIVALGLSSAAFSANTSNASTWSSGTVSLTNDHASALFTANGLNPGDTESKCITVISTSTSDTNFKMYGSDQSATTDLTTALNLTIEQGGGAAQAQGGVCTGFTPTSTIFTGTLDEFTSHTDFASGIMTQDTLPAGGSAQFRITVELPNNTPNSAQNKTAASTFIWESQSR